MLPPPPEDLPGQELKIEFVSILAQMQRMIGLGQIERTLGFAGSLAAGNPDVMDLIDGDETLREYADRAGTPPRLMRDAETVAKIRAGRAQQQRMQQMLAAAPAVKDGAEAFAKLSAAGVGQGGAVAPGGEA
jgi:hypothetical protein